MSANWERLLETLRRESGVVAELEALGCAKRGAIRDLDVGKLEETNAREELRALQLRELGQTRRKLIQEICGALSPVVCAGLSAGAALSLREVIPMMPEQFRAEASGLRQKLLDQVRRLSEVTQGNSELLRNSIERVDRLAQILLGGVQGEITYQVKKRPARPVVSVVDRQG